MKENTATESLYSNFTKLRSGRQKKLFFGGTATDREGERVNVGKYSNTAIWQGFRPVPSIIPISQSCELVGQMNLVFG